MFITMFAMSTWSLSSSAEDDATSTSASPCIPGGEDAAPSPSRASVPRGEGVSAVAAEPAEAASSSQEDNDQVDIANMVMSVVNSLQAQNPNIRVQFLGARDRGTHTDFTPQQLQELLGTMNLNQSAAASASSSSPPAAGSFQGVPFSGQGHRLD